MLSFHEILHPSPDRDYKIQFPRNGASFRYAGGRGKNENKFMSHEASLYNWVQVKGDENTGIVEEITGFYDPYDSRESYHADQDIEYVTINGELVKTGEKYEPRINHEQRNDSYKRSVDLIMRKSVGDEIRIVVFLGIINDGSVQIVPSMNYRIIAKTDSFVVLYSLLGTIIVDKRYDVPPIVCTELKNKDGNPEGVSLGVGEFDDAPIVLVLDPNAKEYNASVVQQIRSNLAKNKNYGWNKFIPENVVYGKQFVESTYKAAFKIQRIKESQ